MMPKPKEFPARWSQTALPKAVAEIKNAFDQPGGVQRVHLFVGQQTAYLLLSTTTGQNETCLLLSLGAASASRPLTCRNVSPADVEHVLTGEGRGNVRQLAPDALRSALAANGDRPDGASFSLSSDGRVQLGAQNVELAPVAAES